MARFMKLMKLVAYLLALIGLGCVSAQLPNLRVGLPRDEDSLRCALHGVERHSLRCAGYDSNVMNFARAHDRRVNSQTGYGITRRDIPFGERFKVQFK